MTRDSLAHKCFDNLPWDWGLYALWGWGGYLAHARPLVEAAHPDTLGAQLANNPLHGNFVAVAAGMTTHHKPHSSQTWHVYLEGRDQKGGRRRVVYFSLLSILLQLQTTTEQHSHYRVPTNYSPRNRPHPILFAAPTMLSTTNTRLWTQRRAEQPAAMAAVCAHSKHISRTVQLHPNAARSQLIVTNAVSRRSLVHYRVRGALGWLLALFRVVQCPVTFGKLYASHQRQTQTHKRLVVRLQRSDELPRAAAAREPGVLSTQPAGAEATSRPRIVILGSGWASMSLIQALPANVA